MAAPTDPPAGKQSAATLARYRHQVREWWQTGTATLVSAADRGNGVASSLATDQQIQPGYYILPEKINPDADLDLDALPSGWDNVGTSLKQVANDLNAGLDVLASGNQGNTDDAKAATAAMQKVTSDLCDSLRLARAHYVAAGGRANDLRFFYLSDWVDPQCNLVDDQRPRASSVLHNTFAYDDGGTEDSFDPDNPSSVPDQAFEDGHVKRVQGGSRVTILEQRRSQDNGKPDECRTRLGDDTWWFPCRVLSGTTSLGSAR